MSRETDLWLNRNTLIGFTLKRGNAWHYKASLQGTESNHYPGAIPIGDVERRLFNFTVEPTEVYIRLSALGEPVRVKAVPDKKAWVTDDTNDVLGIFSDGYLGHQYNEWLLENVATILNEELAIGSAGLLQNRGKAWVQVEVENNFETPEGVIFRPNLLAGTSFNGTLATSYRGTATVVVCDNTLEIALGESKGQAFKLRHTRYSDLRIADARAALGFISKAADDFAVSVAELCAETVTDAEWKRVMDAMVPVPEEDGAGKTIANNKRLELDALWKNDERVAPWRGTSYGVLSAFNTWNAHLKVVRGADGGRAERNMVKVLAGQTGKEDREVLRVLAEVKK